jgi:hypothetical protein
MANVPPIPPGSGPRPEVPPRAAGRPQPANGVPFRAHLGATRSRLLAGGADNLRPGAMGPRHPDPHSGSAELPAADVEERFRRAGAQKDRAGEDRERGLPPGFDPLDPMTRALLCEGSQRFAFERATAAAPAPSQASPPDTASLAARVSLEHVMSRFVRRVAWSGDAHTGTARLEFGAGALSGATLTIHSDQGAVRVALELPPGVDGAEWRERIARRLGARGLQIAALDVE